MSRIRSCVLVGVCVLSLASCQARVDQDAKAARTAIDRADSGLSRWLAAGNVDSLAAIFADSIRQFPINGAPNVGRKAVVGYWTTALRWGHWGYTFAADEVVVEGPVAIERGRYTMIFEAGPGAPTGMSSSSDHGHYLTYWRRGDDQRWRMTWTAPVSEVPPTVDMKRGLP